MTEWQVPLIIIAELIFLFFISRQSINQLYYFLKYFFSSNKIVFYIISLIFLPGTVIHELSHFFTAMGLLLRVQDMTILPQWEHNYIKLGSVSYEKKDIIRSILVGIAPIFVGIAIFWWLSELPIFESGAPLWLLVGGVYFIFTLSTTMFSSKQDLVDLVYIVPLIIVIAVFIYIIKFDLSSFFQIMSVVVAKSNSVLYAIVNYLGISIAIHMIFLTGMYLYKFIFIRR